MLSKTKVAKQQRGGADQPMIVQLSPLSACRSAFLAFCNHSESRRLFVHLPGERSQDVGGEGVMRVTSDPPGQLSDKSLVFLKCSHASKLSRESIAEDVVYSECSRLPLQHMELVMRLDLYT